MAFANLAAYLSAVDGAVSVYGERAIAFSAANPMQDGAQFTFSPLTLAAAAANPTPTRTVLGAIPTPPGTGVRRLVFADINGPHRNSNLSHVSRCGPFLCDRLVQSTGLSKTVAGAQTTNLPTAALTRYTSGEGVCIGIAIYTQIDNATTTVVASYTNQAGTAGRTTELIAFPVGSGQVVGCFYQLPLQEGDTGVRSVESVTLGAAAGATPGDFGVVLYKPIALLRNRGRDRRFKGFDLLRSRGVAPVVENDAYLFMLDRGANAAHMRTTHLGFAYE